MRSTVRVMILTFSPNLPCPSYTMSCTFFNSQNVPKQSHIAHKIPFPEGFIYYTSGFIAHSDA